eukprot:Lithocolla_globosa_v1_NODE_1_length_16663_cov_42.954359.p14 type:complete len:131 gc:universal NODE_1_length_16663_cov_42.954359:405-13(-)
MELISLLNYDICQIIEKYVIFNHRELHKAKMRLINQTINVTNELEDDEATNENVFALIAYSDEFISQPIHCLVCSSVCKLYWDMIPCCHDCVVSIGATKEVFDLIEKRKIIYQDMGWLVWCCSDPIVESS